MSIITKNIFSTNLGPPHFVILILVWSSRYSKSIFVHNKRLLVLYVFVVVVVVSKRKCQEPIVCVRHHVFTTADPKTSSYVLIRISIKSKTNHQVTWIYFRQNVFQTRRRQILILHIFLMFITFVCSFDCLPSDICPILTSTQTKFTSSLKITFEPLINLLC